MFLFVRGGGVLVVCWMFWWVCLINLKSMILLVTDTLGVKQSIPRLFIILRSSVLHRVTIICWNQRYSILMKSACIVFWRISFIDKMLKIQRYCMTLQLFPDLLFMKIYIPSPCHKLGALEKIYTVNAYVFLKVIKNRKWIIFSKEFYIFEIKHKQYIKKRLQCRW